MNRALQYYVNSFKYYISKMLKRRDVYLCFDPYRSYSTKRVPRLGRATQASNFHQLSLSMPLPQQKVVLSVSENKQQPIKVICDELIHV